MNETNIKCVSFKIFEFNFYWTVRTAKTVWKVSMRSFVSINRITQVKVFMKTNIYSFPDDITSCQGWLFFAWYESHLFAKKH